MKWKSLIAVLFIAIIVGQRLPQREYQYAISWDTFGYYLYLPALYYHHDIGLSDPSWAEGMRKKYDLSGTLYQIHHLENGNNVIQYSSGMAFMLAPAFIAGHYAAQSLDYPMDGFSLPYQISVWIWSYVIALIGLFYLRKLLLLFFDDMRVMWLLILTAFATNYFIQTTQAITTSHTYLFALYAIFLYHSVLWHRDKRWKNLLWCAFSLGVMCLSRPTEFIAILLFLMWDFRGLRSQLVYWKQTIGQHKSQFFAFVFILVLCALPQLFYWQVISGKPFIMSYTNPGEGFDFLYPHTIDYLFSYRKGLFVYTPILIFSFLAFIYLWKKNRAVFWSIGVFLIIYIYVISSWSCWWYAHCFGQRSIYQVLPVLAVLLGFFMQWLSDRRWTKYAGAVVLIGCFVLCVFQSYQFATYVIHGSRMTKEYYWAVFGKLRLPDNANDLLLVERPTTEIWPFVEKEKYTSRVVYDFRKEELHKVAMRPDSLSLGEDAQELSAEKAFSEGWQIQWKDLTKHDHNWIHVEAEFYAPLDFKAGDLSLVTCMDHEGGPYGYSAIAIHPDSLKTGDWNSIAYDYLTPEVRVGSDNISTYLWYHGPGKVYLRQLVVTQFEPKK